MRVDPVAAPGGNGHADGMLERQAALLERQAALLERYAGPRETAPREAPPAPPQAARVDAVGASWRYPLLVIIPALILGAIGYIVAHRKTQMYTAQSQVLVGQPAPSTSGELPGVVSAQQALASVYAREISFTPVVAPLARHFHVAQADISSRLSATPVPDAPIIRVQATAKTSHRAVALANGAGNRLAKFVTSQSQNDAPALQALGTYRQAAAAVARARAHAHNVDQAHPNAPNDPAVIDAATRVQVAQLMQNIQGTQYETVIATQHNTPSLNMFQTATTASSNGKSNLELYVAGGVIAGLVVGAALATLLANRRAIRDARRVAASSAA